MGPVQKLCKLFAHVRNIEMQCKNIDWSCISENVRLMKHHDLRQDDVVLQEKRKSTSDYFYCLLGHTCTSVIARWERGINIAGSCLCGLVYFVEVYPYPVDPYSVAKWLRLWTNLGVNTTTE